MCVVPPHAVAFENAPDMPPPANWKSIGDDVGFVTVTDCTGLVAPTGTAPKSIVTGDNTNGKNPFTVADTGTTFVGPSTTDNVIDVDFVTGPSASGCATKIVSHDSPGANVCVEPPHSVEFETAPDMPPPANVNSTGDDVGFVILNTCGPLDVPTATSPKSNEPGDTANGKLPRSPVPVRWTVAEPPDETMVASPVALPPSVGSNA